MQKLHATFITGHCLRLRRSLSFETCTGQTASSFTCNYDFGRIASKSALIFTKTPNPEPDNKHLKLLDCILQCSLALGHLHGTFVRFQKVILKTYQSTAWLDYTCISNISHCCLHNAPRNKFLYSLILGETTCTISITHNLDILPAMLGMPAVTSLKRLSK